VIGYPKIFHTDNGKEFTAKVVLEFLCSMNPNILRVNGRPRHPQDQGSIENMSKFVKRNLAALFAEQRMAGENPNWTEVLGAVSAAINSQHGRGKNDSSLFEAVYGQVFHHEMSCTTEEACNCWTLPQRLQVTNDPDFHAYATANYYLADDEGGDLSVDDGNDDGYFSDETLPSDKREEVSDEYFFEHLEEDELEEVEEAGREWDPDDILNADYVTEQGHLLCQET